MHFWSTLSRFKPFLSSDISCFLQKFTSLLLKFPVAVISEELKILKDFPSDTYWSGCLGICLSREKFVSIDLWSADHREPPPSADDKRCWNVLFGSLGCSRCLEAQRNVAQLLESHKTYILSCWRLFRILLAAHRLQYLNTGRLQCHNRENMDHFTFFWYW